MRFNNKRFGAFVHGAALVALVLAAPSALAYDTEPAWVTNSYFKADASQEVADRYVNGSWTLNAPDVSESKFAIDSTQSVFTVEADGQTSTRKVVRVDCNVTIDDCYYQDDLALDVPSAIAAVTLATNDEAAASGTWMGLTGGDTWTELTGVTPEAAAYTVRVEVDYAPDTPIVRYGVKASDADGFTYLEDGNGTSWFSTQAGSGHVGTVAFCGKADVSDFAAKLSTTAVAEANYTDFDDIANALEEAKKTTPTQGVVLYQNDEITTKQLKGDLAGATYTIESVGGAVLTLTKSGWTSSDVTGVEATYSGGVLTVSEAKNLVAKIVSGDTDTAYLTLADAFVDADSKTVVVLVDCAENTTLGGKTVTLDLDGKKLTRASDDSAILTVNASANLTITNGAICGAAAEKAAISVAGGATVTIDDLAVTNNAIAIDAAGASVVTLKGGLFTGAFTASDDNTKIKILGGYYLGNNDLVPTYASGKIEATGGKFTDVSSNALVTASGIVSADYKLAALAVPFTTNDFTLTFEVMKKVYETDPSSGEKVEVPGKVWTVTESGATAEATVGGVQIADQWIADNVSGDDNAAKQANLNADAGYVSKSGAKMKKWEAYVLGMTATETSAGPVVKGVQDTNAGTIGFSIMSPTAIRTAESGCDVKFSVTPCTNPELTAEGGTESDKVDYTGTVNVAVPNDGKVRYYRLKMYVSPKK